MIFNADDKVIIGETNIVKTTLRDLKSISIGGKYVTNIVKLDEETYSFMFPTLVDNKTTSIGNVAAVVDNGLSSLVTTVKVIPNKDYSYIELTDPINHTKTGIVFNFSPVAKQGDYIIYPLERNTSIDSHANIKTDKFGFKTYWHIERATMIARKFVVTTGE